jgi:hypothetical protein
MQRVRAAIASLALITGLCCGGVPGITRFAAQQTQPQPAEQRTERFAGTVVELTATRMSVARSILGGDAEKRAFLLKPDTRVEGRLRMRARVTVGFISTPEGDVARLIVVRDKKKP